MEQRVEVGVRIELTQRFEDLLAAAHARQPVVDERDFHTAAAAGNVAPPTRWYTCSVFSTERSQENSRARSRPFWRMSSARAGSVSTRRRPSTIESTSCGSTST